MNYSRFFQSYGIVKLDCSTITVTAYPITHCDSSVSAFSFFFSKLSFQEISGLGIRSFSSSQSSTLTYHIVINVVHTNTFLYLWARWSINGIWRCFMKCHWSVNLDRQINGFLIKMEWPSQVDTVSTFHASRWLVVGLLCPGKHYQDHMTEWDNGSWYRRPWVHSVRTQCSSWP